MLKLPHQLEQFRSRIESTVKHYIEIQPYLTSNATLWQSKIAGFPYMPKTFEYPKTPEGEWLYLLAQINFSDMPKLDKYPDKGILQFYLSDYTDKWGDSFYGYNFREPTNQSYFRVVYFPDPDMNEENLVQDFNFLPTLWEKDGNTIPFCVFSKNPPHRNECFSLDCKLKFAPITYSDYKCEESLGDKFGISFENAEDEDLLYDQYSEISGEQSHKIGGYPFFTQDDPRIHLTDDEDRWVLLLQINSDSRERGRVAIQWGDVGVCNFFITESALKKLDFSTVLYNWDCG